MRTPIIAGNWKMNKTLAEAEALARDLAASLAPFAAVERVLCPPAVALTAVAAVLRGTGIGLGAQNMHWESAGAYTGEISAPMLAGWRFASS